jgi:8-oxo-dGTP pyrophosphatase MutT (NUDIX family)
MHGSLARALAAVLVDSASVPTPTEAQQPIPAAVLVALRAPACAQTLAAQLAATEVVLTERRLELRRHAGEISFPGGRFDASDSSLEETALREAEEEIGLQREEVTPLGALPPVFTFTTNYVVYPFVGLLERFSSAEHVERESSADPPGVGWRTSAREVRAVLELSLGDLRAGRGRTRLERHGAFFETDTYTVGSHLIWGATSRIIDELLNRLAPLS